MIRNIPAFIGALLLAGATASFAQTPPADAGKGGQRQAKRDCSQAADPKACEERRAKMRESHAKAKQACEGKQGKERRECMGSAMCAQAKDPALCNQQAKERQALREKHRAERENAKK